MRTAFRREENTEGSPILFAGFFDPVHLGDALRAQASGGAGRIEPVLLDREAVGPDAGACAADREAMLRLQFGADITIHRIGRLPEPADLRKFLSGRFSGETAAGARIVFAEEADPDGAGTPEGGIRAAGIRRRVREGRFLRGLVHVQTERFIGERRLYGPPEQPTREAILRDLEKNVSPRRLRHILGVEETMEKLARAWGADIPQARLCGLLHDCAKGWSLGQMRRAVEEAGLGRDPGRWENGDLLHGPAGAARAKREFGVTDPAILHAVEIHTTGAPAMGILDKMLFLADMTEPGRTPFDGLERIRSLSMSRPDEAVALALESKIQYVRECGVPLHPDTEKALAFIQRGGNYE